MALKFKGLTGLLVLVTAAIGFTSAAIAEPTSSTGSRGIETISERFGQYLFKNEPDFFRNRSFESKINLIFGLNSFPERKVIRDGELIDRLYQSVLYQQSSTDPIIRTPDLPNPYDTSVQMPLRSDVNQLDPSQ